MSSEEHPVTQWLIMMVNQWLMMVNNGLMMVNNGLMMVNDIWLVVTGTMEWKK